jgi:hypothetical protein
VKRFELGAKYDIRCLLHRSYHQLIYIVQDPLLISLDDLYFQLTLALVRHSFLPLESEYGCHLLMVWEILCFMIFEKCETSCTVLETFVTED